MGQTRFELATTESSIPHSPRLSYCPVHYSVVLYTLKAYNTLRYTVIRMAWNVQVFATPAALLTALAAFTAPQVIAVTHAQVNGSIVYTLVTLV